MPILLVPPPAVRRPRTARIRPCLKVRESSSRTLRRASPAAVALVALNQCARSVRSIAYLQAAPLLRTLDGDALARLVSRVGTQRYEEGETVFAAGAAADRFHIIAQGQVEALQPALTGAPRRLALLRNGDYFGEMALLDDIPRTATIRAMAPPPTVALERRTFVQLLESTPALRSAFAETVAARRQANRALVEESEPARRRRAPHRNPLLRRLKR